MSNLRPADEHVVKMLKQTLLCLLALLVAATTHAAELYEDYKEWYVKFVGKKVPSHKRFGTALARKFKKDTAKDGLTKYYGIKLR